MNPSSLMTMGAVQLPGFSLHLATTAKMKKFDETFEENMAWLKEVLEDAKRQYGREEMAIFPKTPAMKRRRQRIARKVSTLHNDDTDVQPPVRTKRSSRVSMIGKSRQSIGGAAPLRRSARTSVRATITSAQNGRSRSRTSKKVKLTEDGAGQMQELSSSDASSSSEDVSGTERVISKDGPKRSTDSGVITTAEVPEDVTKEEPSPEDVMDVKEAEGCQQQEQKTRKRSTTSKSKRVSKKLRLNGGEGVLTVSDSTTSDECDGKSDLIKQSTVDPPSGSPMKDPEQVKSDGQPVSDDTTSTTGRPKRKNAASRYKDHVKRLISRHEHLIADQVSSSEDEFMSPKGKRAPAVKQPVKKTKKAARGGKNQEKVAVTEVIHSTPEKETGVVEEKAVENDVHAETSTQQAGSKEEETASSSEEHVSTETSPARHSSETAQDDRAIPEVQSNEVVPTKDTECSAVVNLEINAEPEKAKDVSVAVTQAEEPVIEAEVEVDSLNQQSITEDSLEQQSIAEDSLNQMKTPDNPRQQPPPSSPSPANMTSDSLDQVNITQDSLGHNDISGDSLNQSASQSRQTRQSLRKALRNSTRRSSVATSRSKKRSSVYQHRASVRSSVRLSIMRNPRSSRASTRASSRASTRASVCRGTVEDAHQEMTPEKDHDVVLEEEIVDSPEGRLTTPPMSSSVRPPVINQETQRLTRAASRLAENTQSPANDPAASSASPETSPDRINENNDSSSDEDILCKTPSPKCPANKVVRPKSTFLSASKEPRYLNNLHGMVSSFLKRNTPQKQTAKERQQEIKKNILNKQRRDEEIRRKLEADKQKQRELQKQKRDERIKKVTEARERRAALQQQKRQEIEQKQQQMNLMTSKQREDKRQEEAQRKQTLIKKKAEADERRRQEEVARKIKIAKQEEEQKRHQEMILRKKEFEDQERQRRIEEARRVQEQRRAEMERQRQEELQKRREVELAKEREQQLLREERERERRAELERKRELERQAREEAAERERQLEAERRAREQERQQDQKHLADMMQRERERRELEKQELAEHERLKASILKHNTSACQNTSTCLNTTVTKETESPQCYEITPKRKPVPSTANDYNIDNLNSDDSTDEEDAPRKKIPSWAQGAALKAALIKQHYHPPPNLDNMFGPIVPPELGVIFATKKPRYLKRTSSAVWDSPMLKI